jgi:hypothetical protein
MNIIPTESSVANREVIYLRSNPAVNNLPSACKMTTLTAYFVLILVNISASSVNKGIFMALRAFIRDILTLTIRP